MRRFWHLTWYKAMAELQAENTRLYAGYLWWVFTPLLQLATFYLIFGWLRSGDEDFVSYLFVGIVVYNWFSSSVLRSAACLLSAGQLTSSVDIHKSVFPFSVILVNSVKAIPVLIILIIFLVANGYAISPSYLALPLLIGVEMLFLVAISVGAAAVVPLMPDLQEIISVVIRLGFFASGAMFPLNKLSPEIQSFLYLNPMARIIEQFRIVMLEGGWPEWSLLVMPVTVSLALAASSLYLINAFNRLYPKTT